MAGVTSLLSGAGDTSAAGFEFCGADWAAATLPVLVVLVVDAIVIFRLVSLKLIVI